ncbi:hypothetical protein C8Q77DRAFT_1214387 [Trametes polyzona]|nr:hypothetical protein C8Q77DRAFT_1214387 [Trametes polyzona]
MDSQLKPKVTARMGYERPRPASPFKPPATSLSPPLVRPKAKVNSSANIQTRKAPSVVSPPPSNRTPHSAIPSRAPSPFKPTQTRTQNASPAGAAVKARLGARINGANSTSPLPEHRQRALTSATADSPSYMRTRKGSTSSHLLSSPSHTELSTASSPARSALSLQVDETSSSVSAAPRSPAASSANMRVKAKLSRVAEPGVHSPPSLPSSAHHVNRPARVPSISNLNLSPPLMPSSPNHSPSSTASSPSGQPRFATTREMRPHSYQPPKSYQAFVPNDDLAIRYGSGYSNHTVSAKVDPTSVPLPPQSPPISTLSFSSRSSASRSSASYESQSSGSRSTAPTLHSHVNGQSHARQGSRSSQPRASLDGLGIRSEPVTREPSSTSEAEYADDFDSEPAHHMDETEDDSERKLKAEAKSNRKIADLEITNRSLLAINSSLEATKHKQAKEIRELRRKLRESRLILPPPAYRAVKSSLTHDDEEGDEEEEEEEDDEDDADIIEGKDDDAYRRVKVMIDGLLESCRRALESKPEDFMEGPRSGVAKVLTEEEVRHWRGDNDTETRSTLDADDASFVDSRPLTPSRVAVPGSDDELDSEGEVEASLLEPDIAPLTPLPPITITPSASP